MKMAVLANDQLKSEFLQKGIPENVEITWADTMKVFYSLSDIDVYFDLLFTMDSERISRLTRLTGKPVFINAVDYTLAETGTGFFRINAWPTLLKRSITEVAIGDPLHAPIVLDIFQTLHWNLQLVPDIPGMITPRLIASIINEAYFTLEQNVSTKEEIDIAMKLGTNYPLGPFEWGKKIGMKKVYSLLHKLSASEQRYLPAALLKDEADQQENGE